MRIEVKKIKPNPFRDLTKYKIDSYKVDALVTSIRETSFWDNILARPMDGKYEIAYGHHRLFAIQKVGLEKVDIPVRELDDATMIKIMANENLEEWKLNPSVIKESVRVAKHYLDGELAKCESWEKLKKTNFNLIKILDLKFDKQPERGFQILKGKGVGQTTILKFLGGNWKQWMVQEALAQLKESESMQEAVEVFDTQTDATEFRKIIKKEFKDKVPKGKEKEVAERVAEKVREKKGQIKKGEKTGRHDYRQDMKTFTRMAVENIPEKEAKLKDIQSEIERFNERIRTAYIGSRDLNSLLQELEVKKIEGVKSLFILDSVFDLLQELKKTLAFFGYDYQHLQLKQKEE